LALSLSRDNVVVARYIGLARRFSKFSLVGASGSAMNFALFWLLTERLGVHYLAASTIAFELSMLSNYLLNNNWTFADRKPSVFSARGLISYQIVSLGSLATNLIVVHVLVDLGDFRPVVANVFAIGSGAAWNFCANVMWTWRAGHDVRRSLAQPYEDQNRTPFGTADFDDGHLSQVEISLVIPTFNERPNIAPLLAEIETALTGTAWEAIFVDDSTDGTDAVISERVETDCRVRLLHRLENRGGLAGAVVDGLGEATGTYICVLDADLQHPPSRINELLAEVRRSDADIVIASRYLPGGSSGGLDGPLRHFYSIALRHLSRTVFPRRLAGITDPLGGYFLVRRSVAQAADLRPIGYKILLEVLVRCPWRASAEVPYAFQPRRHGDSKADFRQGLRFLRHLSTLAWECSPLLTAPRMLVTTAARTTTAGQSGAAPS
jgi:putative flippase GtrA